MFEYSFIKFSSSRESGCLFPKPIAVGEKFAIKTPITPVGGSISYSLVDGNGTNYSNNFTIEKVGGYTIFTITNNANIPQGGVCVSFKQTTNKSGINTYAYSNALVFVSDTYGLSKVSYQCNENEFGFPFGSINMDLVSWLPINLKNPQLKQEDKTYVKRNGEVVVLMAKYYKEWEAESEYVPEDWHDKIVAILSCDIVKMDNVLLTKSDSYEIEWDNTIKKACGQKLAKATWKMRANTMERNSNC